MACELRRLLLVISLALAGCSPVRVPETERPRRIVSLDYCADQYVLQFADRNAILALSVDAQKPFSYLRNKAAGIASVRPRTSDVLVLRPDLVVRSYGGDPGVETFIRRAGIPVVQLGFPQTLGEVRSEVLRVGQLLGNTEEAEVIVASMDRRLAAIDAHEGKSRTVLYMTPGGVSAGEETLIDEMFAAAGLRNFLKRPGWHDIPLEQLAYDRPDLVAAAFFESDKSHTGSWSAARHPVARARMREVATVPLEGAWTSCGGWFLLDAVEALAAAEEAGS